MAPASLRVQVAFARQRRDDHRKLSTTNDGSHVAARTPPVGSQRLVIVVLHDGQLPLRLLHGMKLMPVTSWAHTGHKGYSELNFASAQDCSCRH